MKQLFLPGVLLITLAARLPFAVADEDLGQLDQIQLLYAVAYLWPILP